MKTKVATGLPNEGTGLPTRKTGLSPLVCENPRLLILGSLPGDRSLEMQQYYGHPQNRFWKVIAAVHGLPCPSDYGAKKEMLAACRIVLWDVYHAASRPGSMDADIRKGEFNDIEGLLLSFPGISTIALNGSTAAAGFDKYLRKGCKVLNRDVSEMPAGPDGIRTAFSEIAGRRIRILHLPSTSPANARWTLDRLIEIWENVCK